MKTDDCVICGIKEEKLMKGISRSRGSRSQSRESRSQSRGLKERSTGVESLLGGDDQKVIVSEVKLEHD